MNSGEIRTICLASDRELDIVKTFECGQCFRWNADEDGRYFGVVRAHPAMVWTEGGQVFLRGSGSEEMWRDYFDLDRDYAVISQNFKGGEYLDRCIEFGMGIRILRQEPWEALCSFIISQCNNISRIKGIVERLCSAYGEEMDFEGRKFYSFPEPEKLCGLLPEELAMLRCGYRAPYIITAANALCDGSLNLQELIESDCVHARKSLMQLRGIGEKVANCVVLFGLYHMEAFPIDVWMKRALKENFPPDFDPAVLGDFAGLAQQYIFYFARTNGK